jgi:hypothetical protein
MAEDQSTPSPQGADGTACYVYGIVPADVETDPEARGLGDPPSEITLVPCGEIAALVSVIRTDQALGEPQDFRVHQSLLDAAAAEAPVLPFRFGSVMADPESVVEQLLEPYHDEFAGVLRDLDGRVEYLVKGRYVEDAVLREVLREDDRIAELRERVRGEPEDVVRDARIALGELVNQAVTAKRDADTSKVVDALVSLSTGVSPREATHEEDAVNVAFLVETGRVEEFLAAVDRLARDWDGRITLRALGPLAAYDFVTSRQAE